METGASAASSSNELPPSNPPTPEVHPEARVILEKLESEMARKGQNAGDYQIALMTLTAILNSLNTEQARTDLKRRSMTGKKLEAAYKKGRFTQG